MPVMDGMEATIAIRNKFDPPKSQVPIIALTANAIQGDNQKCLDAGMDNYLSKPFKPRDLKEMLAFYVSTKSEKYPQKDGQEPVMNLEYLKEACYNDKSFMVEMMEVFIKTIPNSLIEIKSAIAQKDWDRVNRAAHKIKPSMSFMGIQSALTIIQSIEHNARNETDTEAIGEKFMEFQEICTTVCSEFKEILKNGQNL